MTTILCAVLSWLLLFGLIENYKDGGIPRELELPACFLATPMMIVSVVLSGFAWNQILAWLR